MIIKCFNASIAVVCNKNTQQFAHNLTSKFNLPIYNSENEAAGVRFLLQWQDDKLSLTDTHTPKQKPFAVDFEHPDWQRQATQQASGKTPLAKAVGIKTEGKRILDITAGWAKDAYQLACLGCQLSLCEQNPVVAALLEDGLRRLAQTAPEIAARMQLQFQDCQTTLAQPNLADHFDVIYFDPMYPEGAYRGQVKKAAQILRLIASEPPNEQAILTAALATQVKRVVVKRPRSAKPVGRTIPHHQIDAKMIRLDVYDSILQG